MRGILIGGALAVAAALTPAALTGGGQVAAAPGQSCFFVRDWEGWKAANDHTIYLNVSGNRIFRLDMAGDCPELSYPGARLISRDIAGNGSVCSPLDLDLKVSLDHGIASACIVQHMAELTPDEAAALPRNLRP
ncbi:MAG TPA: DUF6491 family protein [Caulobacteraceae bacterium]|jgi:hypothetical protein|nr:DUF6491 family protein [Caulobacteraceae bacterium]